MKLVTFEVNGHQSFGATDGSMIWDLAGVIAGVDDLRGLLGQPDGLAKAAGHMAASAASHRLDQVALKPVIPNPDKIICVGLNYMDHVQETGRTVTPNPTLFVRFADSQIGSGEAILLPPESTKLDFEGELALIIGKGGRRIAAENAFDHIAGYACYNDGTLRDWQLHTTQFLPGKSFVATGGFGPWMVTADEIADIAGQTLTTRLNGQVMQQTRIDMMLTPIPQLIAYISCFMPLKPGDVIVSGTPGGVGAKRNPPVWMKPGDLVEVEITGVGLLSNPIELEAV